MTVKTKKKIPARYTPKNKAFVQSRLDNPTGSVTQAVLDAGYKAKDRQVASKIGHQLMQKPEIIMALGEHSELFESAIVQTVKDWKDSDKPRKREIALNAAMFGHDKVHGKATTRIESHSSVVKISINLTGDNDDSPPAELLDD